MSLKKNVKLALIAFLAVGCAFLANSAPAEETSAPRQKLRAVILTPGTQKEEDIAAYIERQSTVKKASGAQQLPNYEEEELTLGLLDTRK